MVCDSIQNPTCFVCEVYVRAKLVWNNILFEKGMIFLVDKGSDSVHVSHLCCLCLEFAKDMSVSSGQRGIVKTSICCKNSFEEIAIVLLITGQACVNLSCRLGK